MISLARTLIKLSLISFILLYSHAMEANKGIAFVHGTSDHREDAYGDYWKTDFIQSIAKNLPNPDNYYVVHCNFNQFMWHEEAGDCVAKQLIEFINNKDISQLTVYTHSNGGNVVRWILSNPSYNSDYMTLSAKIKQVIAIAPSSGGSPIADEIFHGGYFETNLAWLFDYASDALRQQRIGDMLIYNEELLLGTSNRPALPIPFKVIVGTDVEASPFSNASYCNGYLFNAGLKLTKLYLEDCSDGVLNCSSQIKAGKVWFYDKEKTEESGTLSHNQSRHSCLGLDKLLAQALE